MLHLFDEGVAALRVAFRYQDVFPNVSVLYNKDRDRNESIRVQFYDDSRITSVYIKPDDIAIKLKEPDKPVRRLSLDQLSTNQKATITTISHALKLQQLKAEYEQKKSELEKQAVDQKREGQCM